MSERCENLPGGKTKMHKVGIIGGLSPESTVLYYRGINAGVRAKLGGHHSGKILLSSVDFGEFVALKQKDDWDGQAAILIQEAQALERAGADFLVIATNTMHFAALQVEAATSIPLLHIADATAAPMKAAGIKTTGFLGTKYAMELPFYNDKLASLGIEFMVPEPGERADVNQIIYDELTKGVINPKSKERYKEVIASLAARGAEAVILGCTEITMLVGAEDAEVPVFDTTGIHVEAIVAKMLA